MDLWHIPAIDQHAHNILRPEFAQSLFREAFTESPDPSIHRDHAQNTLFYRRSLREIATVLGCAPHEKEILGIRDQLGWEELTRCFFDASRLKAILLDDGFMPGQILPLDWHSQFVSVRRVLRIESLAEDLLGESTQFEHFLDRYRAALDPPPTNVVGLKSIASYRTGLDVRSPSHKPIEAWQEWKRTAGERPRLTNKELLDYLLHQALEVAVKHTLPVQFHTGFGDPDLDLQLANPLHLRALFEDRRFRNVPIVLLHASYPYTREAGYLASVYPQVYLDMGLAIPYLSMSGMRSALRMLLELAPFTKVMYSSDAHMIPELYYLGAKAGREVLGWCLDQAIVEGDLTAEEAHEVAVAVLQGNARTLYGIGSREESC